jgi:ribosomal-protein-alanine N-acetyltransferase
LIKIETDRLIVRSCEASDYLDLFEYLSLPETYVYEPGKPITIEESKELASNRSKENAFLSVVLKQNSKMIGHLYFTQIEPKEFMTWELGYIFNPKYQRKGYATEAANAIVKWGLVNNNIHRIMARCNPKNIASWKLLERIGFKREGHFTKVAFFTKDSNGNPNWHDAYEYSMLKEDK